MKPLSFDSDNLKGRLDGLKRHFLPQASPAELSPDTAPPSRYYRLSEHVDGRLLQREEGSVCFVSNVMRWGDSYGTMVLTQDLAERSLHRASFTVEEIEGTVAVSQLLFFDCETTSLGGAGSVAFLVGCGSVTPQGFEVRQYLLPDYSDETAMLEYLLDEFMSDRTLVSFNGAAFDAPLLTDRLIMNRVARELPARDHIDLLHPSRRLFRRRLQDCRLVTLEKELFSFHREDDIPGYLVPSVYFDWLSNEDLDLMRPVLEHNRLDILSMFFLACSIDRAFSGEGETLERVEDIYSLSRVYGRRKRHDQVVRLLDSSIARSAANREMLFYQSMALKRQGVLERAVEHWTYLARDGGSYGFQACLELAKYFEHRRKDPSEALQFARQARRWCPERLRIRTQVEHRIARLERRLLSALSDN